MDYLSLFYQSVGIDDTTELGSVGGLISRFLPLAYTLAVLVALATLILAGIKLQTKSKDGLQDAKKMLMYGGIGFAVILGATVITHLIVGLFSGIESPV